MEINKLEGETRDLAADNIDALKQVFPESVTDGKVDVEKLKELLGEEVEEGEERYSFTWPGKRDAIKLAISRNTGTLRLDKESSKDWDTTKNLFIEGDNLEVLRVLQNTYRGKVKMIYIDPPYNTGKDFVYKDDFKDNVANYKEQAGLAGQSNADTSGRYHTNWLNMMYPRLRLAKNLLKDDGVIFISIDDNEVNNLRKVCDEIFGEENFVGTLIHQRAKGGGMAKNFVNSHDYIHVYARSIDNIDLKQKKIVQQRVVQRDGVDYVINDDLYRRTFGGRIDRNAPHRCYFYEELEEAKGVEEKNHIDEKIAEGTYFLKEHVSGNHLVARYEKISDLYSKVYGIIKILSEEGKAETDALIGEDIFSYPKPTALLKLLIEISTHTSDKDKSDVILDFFSGSGSTAHAVLLQNVEDGGNRRFIMVQLPEITTEDSAARKAGYETIAEISRERIRRAGEKVRTDYAEKLTEREVPLDIGFKAFTLDSTNFREWDVDTEDINASLLAALDTFKDGRDAEDALYEVLLKYGVDITEPVEILKLDGKTVYSLAGNYLLVCLEKKITLETIEEMTKLKPARVVCYDDGFESDEVKQNAIETLKRAGVEDVRVI